jgi:hypothetical protein
MFMCLTEEFGCHETMLSVQHDEKAISKRYNRLSRASIE